MSDGLNSSVPGDHPHDNTADVLAQAREAKADVQTESPNPDRRKRRRALISAPVRVRCLGVPAGGPDEISTTLDVSRGGLLFASSLFAFVPGMHVAVTFPYSKSLVAVAAEQPGRVARVVDLPDGRRAVAIALGGSMDSQPVNPVSERPAQAVQEAPAPPEPTAKRSGKPVILVVDSDVAVRDSLKNHLTEEGYEVIAVPNAAEAHVVLSLATPTLVVAEIEGDDLPGYDLCARIKTTPHLQNIPVMLLTRSAYPSDYANGHSLGAVVCMAKPFRMDRMAHVVRLLAPNAQAKQPAEPPRAADTTRKHHPAKPRSSAKRTGRNNTRPRR